MNTTCAAALAERLQPLDSDIEADIRAMHSSTGSVAVIVRDACRPRSIADPFTFAERVSMLQAAFPSEMADGSLRAIPVASHSYDAKSRLDAIFAATAIATGSETLLSAGLTAEEAAISPESHVHIRQLPRAGDGDPAHLFELITKTITGQPGGVNASENVREWLREFSQTKVFHGLLGELAVIRQVRERYGPGPHGTADAICTWRDQILLITRGNPPFKGQLAIPGGILDKGEAPINAAARELAEETCISGPGGPLGDEAVKAAVTDSAPRIYDSPWRDPRGRYIANTFHFDLSHLEEPPAVAAGDDAAAAQWHPMSSLSPDHLAFDHFAMLHDFLGLPWKMPDPKNMARGISGVEIHPPIPR